MRHEVQTPLGPSLRCPPRDGSIPPAAVTPRAPPCPLGLRPLCAWCTCGGQARKKCGEPKLARALEPNLCGAEGPRGTYGRACVRGQKVQHAVRVPRCESERRSWRNLSHKKCGGVFFLVRVGVESTTTRRPLLLCELEGADWTGLVDRAAFGWWRSCIGVMGRGLIRPPIQSISLACRAPRPQEHSGGEQQPQRIDRRSLRAGDATTPIEPKARARGAGAGPHTDSAPTFYSLAS